MKTNDFHFTSRQWECGVWRGAGVEVGNIGENVANATRKTRSTEANATEVEAATWHGKFEI